MPADPVHPATDRERLLAAAFSLRGAPFKRDAKGPVYYDCSGFTKAAYAKIGVGLPDGSFNQAVGEKPLADVGEMAPGDLILYRASARSGVDHITMYAGNGWAIGSVTLPGKPTEVDVYPLSFDLGSKGRIVTYRHVQLPDEH